MSPWQRRADRAMLAPAAFLLPLAGETYFSLSRLQTPDNSALLAASMRQNEP
jgi:hypothetical protein